MTTKIEGPYRRVTVSNVCNLCVYHTSRMRSRGMRANSDYWYCGHPVHAAENDKKKYIGEGGGACRTPVWCPVLVARGEELMKNTTTT